MATAADSAVSDLLSAYLQETQNVYTAKAEGVVSQGDLTEAGLYGTASEIATNNAALAGISGQLQEFQARRSVFQTLGSQRADVASAGFREAGSSLSLLRSSTQQGNVAQQLIATQAGLQAGGFQEQSAAANAEGSAATTASQNASALQQAASAAAAVNQSALSSAAAKVRAAELNPIGATNIGGNLVGSALPGFNNLPSLPTIPGMPGSSVNLAVREGTPIGIPNGTSVPFSYPGTPGPAGAGGSFSFPGAPGPAGASASFPVL